MDDKDFRMLYQRLIEYHGLSPPKAKELLQNILHILKKGKEQPK